jgi:hypothetical protein
MLMSDQTSPDLRALPASVKIVNPIKTISWASVLAGAVIAMALQLLLSMLGIGLGLSTDSAQDTTSQAFAMGGTAWWMGSALLALFVGGCVAGFFSDATRWTDGLLHGLLVWALTALVSAYVLGSYAETAARLMVAPDATTGTGPTSDAAARALSQGALLWLGLQVLGAGSAILGGFTGRNLRRRRRTAFRPGA